MATIVAGIVDRIADAVDSIVNRDRSAGTSERTARTEGELGADLFQWKPLGIALGAMFAFYVLVRLYEGAFGFAYGLDSFSEEFKTYWLSILWIELPLEGLAFVGIMSYLWKTRERDLDNVAPREELRRHFVVLSLLAVYAMSLYWGASFYTEQDGTWHQTVVRDTDFTPSHILEFYLSYPIYILCGTAAFMYAKTRIPLFAKGFSVPFLLLFVGPFMIFPNVGLNEWGHTFWFMEELFVAPLHWGFVFFGWMALAIFGVVLQILGRLRELFAASGYEDACVFEEGGALAADIDVTAPAPAPTAG
jgi:methane/ammonia monooxygenase subunit C